MIDNTMERRIACTDAFTEFNRQAEERSRMCRGYDKHYEEPCFGPYFLNGLTTEGLKNPLYYYYEVKE